MKKSLFFLTLFISLHSYAQEIKGPIRIHENQRYFMDTEGQPFFWLADTAWELFHRLDLDETSVYLEKRKAQGFTVIQAVALAEIDGLNKPNANGDLPFLDQDYVKTNEAYWKHVDDVLDLALQNGLHVALLPTWGDKVFKASWGVGPEIFTPEKAYTFGKWIGNRYADQKNIIWVIGGDRNPRPNSEDILVWHEMARGISESQNERNRHLMTFHPQPSEPGGSSNWFHDADWLDFNMHQTGHCPNQATYQKIAHDLALSPKKPSLDGEPMYEEHPKCFDAKNQGYSEAVDIRRIMYWNVFAGAAGQSYGCHAVWQMYDLDKDGINGPLKPWYLSLDLETANQVVHLKNLMLSRPFFDRIPNQQIIATEQADDAHYVAASSDRKGRFAMIYIPSGKTFRLNLSSLNGDKIIAHWFDPRTGFSFPLEQSLSKTMEVEIQCPSTGRGNDWVLLVDAED